MKLVDYCWSLNRISTPPVLMSRSNWNAYINTLFSVALGDTNQLDLFSFFSIDRGGIPLYNMYAVDKIIGICYIRGQVFRDVGSLDELFWSPGDPPKYDDICRILNIK